MTDQYVDIGGIRFILINSGAIYGLADTAGWPVPVHGGSVGGDPRVAWLRGCGAGTRNVVVTHHPRWSFYGNHHDNPAMQNLIDEIAGPKRRTAHRTRR